MVKQPNYPHIEVDDLTAAIRESIARRGIEDRAITASVPAVEVSSVTRTGAKPEVSLRADRADVSHLKLQPDFRPNSGDRYHVNDLLRYHDRMFVQSAYRAILGRYPDDDENERDLKSLHSGRLNKIDVLVSLRFSVEGKARKVKVDGLTLPALIRRLGRLPVIGYVIRLGITLLRLPNLVRDQRQFDGYLLSQNQQIADFINLVSAEVSQSRSKAEEELSKQSHLLEILGEEQRAMRQQQELLRNGTSARFSELNQQLEARMNVQQHLVESTESKLRAEIERVYLRLQRTRAGLTQPGSNVTSILGQAQDRSSSDQRQIGPTTPAETHRLDALYAALEDRFRGSRKEIKERFRQYLPYIRQTDVVDSASVVDLGCGRGEWLEILKEEGIKACGVDTNRVLIEQCRERDLEVIEDDVIMHLRSLGDESLGAVTGFHIIEHISIDTLISLLDEVVRVLRPGGAVIFETPNPDNVLVGSNYFYLDPTHRHPLPSPLMQFLIESRGLHRTEVINLHAWDSARVNGNDELADRFNGYFYGPMDYAVLGWKVEA
jgi:SAM-dependent methyltransferase